MYNTQYTTLPENRPVKLRPIYNNSMRIHFLNLFLQLIYFSHKTTWA